MQGENKEKEEIMLLIPKSVWLELLEAYDKQTNKFVSTFKTISICVTIAIIIWFGLYFWCNRPYINNGIVQHGETNQVENTYIENGGKNQ